MRSKTSLSLAATAAALALTAADASAATYCVDKPGCSGTATTLPAALTAAAAAGADRIELGPGVHATPAGFAYTGAPSNTLEIVGSGDATVLRPDTGSKGAAFTTLSLSGAGSSVKDLRILAPASTGGALTRGLALGTGAAAQGVEVGEYQLGVKEAVALSGASTFAGGEVVLTDATGATGVRTLSGTSTIADSRIAAPVGIAQAPGSELTVRRSRLDVRQTGFAVTGAVLKAESVLLDRAGPGGYFDTIVATDGGGLGATVKASHLTSTSPGNKAVSATTASDKPVTVEVDNSLLNDGSVARTSTGTGAATVTIRDSWRGGATDTQSGPGTLTVPASGGALPRFVDTVNDDWRLQPGTDHVGIDSGRATPFVPSTGGDADGRTRVRDGDRAGGAAPDMGAFEYQAHDPKVVLTGPATAEVGQPLTYEVALSDDDPAETQSIGVLWSFSEQLGDPMFSYTTSRKIWFDTPGEKYVSVSVLDTGGGHAEASMKVMVTGEAKQQAQPAGQPQPPLPEAPPQRPVAPQPPAQPAAPVLPKPAADVAAPALGGLRLAATSVRAGRPAVLRMTLGEAARVEATVERRAGRRWRRAAKVARTVAAGKVALSVPTKRLAPGSYRVRVRAADAAGNAAPVKTLALRVKR